MGIGWVGQGTKRYSPTTRQFGGFMRIVQEVAYLQGFSPLTKYATYGKMVAC